MSSPASQPRIPIAQLNPDLLSLAESSVEGIVTLIWPYNSLTQSLSFLLVEPDFRLRRHQGQVRIQLVGSGAYKLSKEGLSSGDSLLVTLEDASWERDSETANTPGKGIAWTLMFRERLRIKVGKELLSQYIRANIFRSLHTQVKKGGVLTFRMSPMKEYKMVFHRLALRYTTVIFHPAAASQT